MGYKRITPRQRSRLEKLVNQEGRSIRSAAQTVGVSTAWAYQHMRAYASDQSERDAIKQAEGVDGPVPYDQLSPVAKRAWDDFDLWRRRYLGHISMPWQVEAAEQIIQSYESDRREFGVMNVAPGTGKSTLVRDIAMWLTVRNRRVRGLMGSSTQAKAESQLGVIRRTLQRTTLARADEDMARMGLACDAEATLAADYGLFRPLDKTEPWRADGLLVVQYDFELTTEKELTWTAYGLDVDYLGERIDFALWDDATVPRDLTTQEKIDQKRRNFDTITESRIEPRAALWLVGQRIGANDLYRHALDKRVVPDDDDELDALEAMSESDRTQAYDGMPRKYRHIVYRAHDEERCQGEHRRDSPAWPAGCLIDPIRVPWRELRTLKHNDQSTYSVWYQQEDADLDDTLVRKVWVSGGTDPETGTTHWGCWDNDRGLNELPKHLKGQKFCFATIDPSPTRYWAIQKWVCVPEAENQVFLMDLVKAKLTADQVLEWRHQDGEFFGIMESWQAQSVKQGLPISHWIIERNGAQRFLLQYEFVRRWIAKWGTNIVAHDTNAANKSDPEYGVYVLREPWRTGRVRLPGKGPEARLASMKLVDEVQRYPHSWTDDQVMAMWFLFFRLPQLTVLADNDPDMRRPTWLSTVPDARRLVVA